MKKFLFVLVSIFFSINIANAQLPAGSYAPDFKLFEIDKTTGSLITSDTIHLYEYLDAGKPTMIDFSATWCGPCWSYHSTHAMDSAFNMYGPNGTDEMRVLFIEGSYGNYNSLKGTGNDASGSGTQGNWLANSSYPFIPANMSPNTKTVVTNYKIGYFPTLYMVCPNRSVVEISSQNISRPNTQQIYDYAKACPCFAEISDNAAIFNLIEPHQSYSCKNSVTPKIILQNTGSSNLTKVEFAIDLDGTTSNHTWTGNLAKYEIATVTLPTLTDLSSTTHNYTITINTANDVADTDTVQNSVTTTFAIYNEATASSLNEDFSASGLPAGFWSATNEWDRYSTSAIFYFGYYARSSDTLYLPILDLTNVQNVGLAFDVAHQALKSGSTVYYDRLKVEVSTCGSNKWTSIYDKSSTLQTTDPTTTTLGFVPLANQWRKESVEFSSHVSTGAEKFLIRFVAIPNKDLGNIIWIDNIVVGSDIVGINDIENKMQTNIYPNPASTSLYIQTEANISQSEIYNIQGQCVKKIQSENKDLYVGDLASGVYMLRITTDSGISTHKFIKQ